MKQDEEARNIWGMRLLMVYGFASLIVNTYRAYKIYQTFDSWVALNRDDKINLAWGIASFAFMAVLTAPYTVVEYRRRQMGKKDKEGGDERMRVGGARDQLLLLPSLDDICRKVRLSDSDSEERGLLQGQSRQ
ncbi:hypothetical protein V493_01789 [Pseudogymnoascus sp. VKM F-4281 (FW-2241)]|nr:hypothetical protein V493_01789 [Pseudogymnoascus sp. VKM F-4281 (FW-2241)]